MAQIPNNGFDIWTNNGLYETPSNWDNLNQITYGSSVSTCIKGTPGYSGVSYLILRSKTIIGKGVFTVSSALLVSIGFINNNKTPKMDKKRKKAKNQPIFDLFLAL